MYLGGMNDIKPKLIVVAMFLKLDMSLIPNNPADISESPIWNTLVPPGGAVY